MGRGTSLLSSPGEYQLSATHTQCARAVEVRAMSDKLYVDKVP